MNMLSLAAPGRYVLALFSPTSHLVVSVVATKHAC